jgi:hypothetical protein
MVAPQWRHRSRWNGYSRFCAFSAVGATNSTSRSTKPGPAVIRHEAKLHELHREGDIVRLSTKLLLAFHF